MNLIIVESPTKAKTLSRFLGSEYQIEASYGHIRDLPKSTLGIDTEHDFTPHYIIPQKSKARAKELAELAKKAEKIILATDPDREGEAIAWHVSKILSAKDMKILSGKKKKNHLVSQYPNILISRIVFHEITEGAIKEALNNPREINMRLVDSQQARRVLDRLVGYKLSPLLWNKIRRGLSAGRVQSVAVRLIVEREKEIKAFVPEKYWEIETWLEKTQNLNVKTQNQSSNLKANETKNQFKAKLVQINEAKAEIKSEEQANKIKDDLLKSEYKVKSVETKNVNRFPYPPYNTSTLTQACANLYYWGAKKTMMFAQQLFEAGYITYHRTDSFNLAFGAINEARKFIKENYGVNYLPEKPKFYKTKSKVAQEAHEAIRPTNIYGIVNYEERIKEEIGRDAWMLYGLIAKRMIACQMKEVIYERTGVEVEAKSQELGAKSYGLKANGSKLLFDGWLRAFNDGKNEEAEAEAQILPPLSVEEKLNLRKINPIEVLAKQTEPPPRYNEASLIKTLEEYGIGRPSTYAPIISTIQERLYVEKVERRFEPTVLGFSVNDFLIKHFPEILDYQFTAHIEDDLDKIANGQMEWVPVIREFYEPFSQKLAVVYKQADRVKIEVEKTEELCSQCGANLVVRMGRFGKFLACSKFPECKFTKSFAQATNFKCPKCGGEVIIKMTRRRRKFYGCKNYPQCDYASWRKPQGEITTVTKDQPISSNS